MNNKQEKIDGYSVYNSERTIKNLEGYIQFLREYKEKNNGEIIWYRGQRIKSRPLEPTLYRGKEFTCPDTKGIIAIRYNFNIDFLEELGIFKEKLKEKHIFQEWFNDFHYMFIGQHYGLETPALDWTTDPLVALYFAISHCKDRDDSTPIVFLLKPMFTNKNYAMVTKNGENISDVINIDNMSNANEFLKESFSNPNKFNNILCVETKKDICHRMSRQSGTFTLLSPIQPFQYPWIQTTINGEKLGTSVLIDRESVAKIMDDLSILGITEDKIMGEPDYNYDKVCKEIVNSLKHTK